MDKNLKSALAISGVAIGLILAISAAYYTFYFSKSIQPAAYRSFTVTGEGKINAVPDIATFSFSIVTEGGMDVSSLQKENVDKVNAAIAYIKDNGVEAKDIQTRDYSLNPRYQYTPCDSSRPCPPAEVIGYTISQTVSVKIRELAKAGALLSGVVNVGATNVSQLSFTIDEPTKLQNEARIEALADARTKAEEIAKSSGFQLGKILSIDDGGSYPTPMPYYGGIGMKTDAAVSSAPAPTIEPGSQDIIVNVSVRYEIK